MRIPSRISLTIIIVYFFSQSLKSPSASAAFIPPFFSPGRKDIRDWRLWEKKLVWEKKLADLNPYEKQERKERNDGILKVTIKHIQSYKVFVQINYNNRVKGKENIPTEYIFTYQGMIHVIKQKQSIRKVNHLKDENGTAFEYPENLELQQFNTSNYPNLTPYSDDIRAVQFVDVILSYVFDEETEIIDGTYHYERRPVRHYFNPKTRVNVMFDRTPEGKLVFLSAFRLSKEQREYLLTTRHFR